MGRFQLHGVTARDCDRRVLKCRNDFSNRVPLNVNATHLKTRVYGPRRQPVLGQGRATPRLVRSRKGLIGLLLISAGQADE